MISVYITVPIMPAPSITRMGSGLNFLSANRLAANNTRAAISRSAGWNVKSPVPKSAVSRMDTPEAAIKATTAGRSPFMTPWTRLRPLNL